MKSSRRRAMAKSGREVTGIGLSIAVAIIMFGSVGMGCQHIAVTCTPHIAELSVMVIGYQSAAVGIVMVTASPVDMIIILTISIARNHSIINTNFRR